MVYAKEGGPRQRAIDLETGASDVEAQRSQASD
jgi:hypothetical protein